METKKQIRTEVLKRRDKLSREEIREKSAQIAAQVLAQESFQRAEQVLVFVSFASEVDTTALIRESLRLHKKVFCPRIEDDTMNFYRILDLRELSEGFQGILEPGADRARSYEPRETDFMLMPGTVFDREKNRIGYGKGFYDKFIARGFWGTKLAVCYSLQLVDNGRIPFSPNDIRPDCILTEEERIE